MIKLNENRYRKLFLNKPFLFFTIVLFSFDLFLLLNNKSILLLIFFKNLSLLAFLIIYSKYIRKLTINEILQIYEQPEIINSTEDYHELFYKHQKSNMLYEQKISQNAEQIDIFDKIFNSIPNEIFLIDTDQKTIFINQTASTTFKVESATTKNILEIVRNNQFLHLLNKSLSENKYYSQELNIGLNLIYKVIFNPIILKNDSKPYCVVFMQDITQYKKLEQIRTDFVANVTHELKTPLTSIQGFVETLKNGAIKDEIVSKRFLDIIEIESERLYTLINDILSLSEIETKKEDNDIKKHNLMDIFSESIQILEHIAKEKNIKINVNIETEINIRVNKNRIKQLIINLVDNAIKYNKENGSIEIQAFSSAKILTLHVKDTGIGIATDHLPRIFERFYRVDKSRSKKLGGTGLGLSIVKHIVNLYSGDIKVISELNKGTEITIRLPVVSKE